MDIHRYNTFFLRAFLLMLSILANSMIIGQSNTDTLTILNEITEEYENYLIYKENIWKYYAC